MQFKAKIKTMNPQLIRGTRLFPVQVFTADSSKSIQIPSDLSRSSYQGTALANQNITSTIQSQSFRSSTRHTTDFSATRPQMTRLSLDQVVHNRGSIEDSSRQNSQRTHNLSIQNKSTSNTKQTNLESFNPARTSIQIEQSMFSNLKDLRIQRIQSIETAKTNPILDQSHIQPIRQFSIEKDGPSLELFSKNSNLQNYNTSTFQSLYLSYKVKYNNLQGDYFKLIQKFKNCQQYIEALQGERSRKEQYLSASRHQRQTIDAQNKSIQKLEQSISKSRSINEMLMKKEKDYERRIKKMEEQHEQQWKKRAEILKQQIWNEANDKNEQVIQNLQKINFQFKLKLIDQANNYLEQLAKAKQTFQSLLLKKEEQIKTINAQKIQSHQSLLFHVQESQNKSKIIRDLQFQNSSKQQMLQRLNHQLSSYKNQLNAYMSDNNQLIQLLQEINRQKQRVVTSFTYQLNQMRLNATKLQNDLQSLAQTLEDTIEDKENIIAKLNKYKSAAQLEILELKNQIKNQSQQKEKDYLAIANLKKQAQHLVLVNNKLKAQKEQKQSLNNQLKKQLQDSKIQINSLKNSLGAAEQKIELMSSQYELKIYNLLRQLEDKTSQKDQVLCQLENMRQQLELKIIQNSQQMTEQISQNLVFKMEILEQLKQNKQRIALLQDQCQKLKEQAKQLESLNSTLEEEKRSYEEAVTASKNKIIELTFALQQLRKQVSSEEQRKTKEKQISEREEQLKKVQSEYLELIEGQLKKLYEAEQQNIGFNEKQRSFQLVNFFSQKKLSSRQNSPSKSMFKQINQSFQDALEEDVAKLRQRVQQLTFVNSALKRKVEQLSQIEESSNVIIMDRIKAFEEQIEAILDEKARTEQCNAQISLKLHQMTDKCIFYEGRIDWLEANYKALETNLVETQEELMKSEFKYINLKIMPSQIEEQLEHSQYELQPIDIHEQIENAPDQKDVVIDKLVANAIEVDQVLKIQDQLVGNQQQQSKQPDSNHNVIAQEIKDSQQIQGLEVKCEQLKQACVQQCQKEEIREQDDRLSEEAEDSLKEQQIIQQVTPFISITEGKPENLDRIYYNNEFQEGLELNVYTVLSAEGQDHSQSSQISEDIPFFENPCQLDNELPLQQNYQIESNQLNTQKEQDVSRESKPFDIILDILNENPICESQNKVQQIRQTELKSQSNSQNEEQLEQDDQNIFK